MYLKLRYRCDECGGREFNVTRHETDVTPFETCTRCMKLAPRLESVPASPVPWWKEPLTAPA